MRPIINLRILNRPTIIIFGSQVFGELFGWWGGSGDSHDSGGGQPRRYPLPPIHRSRAKISGGTRWVIIKIQTHFSYRPLPIPSGRSRGEKEKVRDDVCIQRGRTQRERNREFCGQTWRNRKSREDKRDEEKEKETESDKKEAEKIKGHASYILLTNYYWSQPLEFCWLRMNKNM